MRLKLICLFKRFATSIIITNCLVLITACSGNSSEPEFIDDGEKPRLVSAGSTSNLEVLVTFSEPMKGGSSSAENPSHYRIVESNEGKTSKSDPATTEYATTDPTSNGEQNKSKAEVVIIDAELIRANTVKLTTLSQSGLNYKLTVTNVTDLSGNTLAPNEILTDPSSVFFTGTPPSGGVAIDTDDDGLSDHDEQVGWSVIIQLENGDTENLEVTSDPLNPDTDGDGVTDNEERHGGLNPRSVDTDGDTLTDNQEWNIIYSDPTHQDTDGDGTQDGFEFYSYRTSPILADTDGDQIIDTEEILGRNRDPRVSDIPSAGISVGEVRLQIDERFTYEDNQGTTVTVQSSSNSTLSQQQNTTYATSDTDVTQHVAGGRLETGFETGDAGRGSINSAGFFFNIEGSYQYTNSNSFTTSTASAIESQQVHEQSINKAREFNTNNTVTREVIGASIDIDLSINNAADLSFAISNIEITVLQRDRQSTNRFVPVATLIANSTLITGEPAVFNLGPFTPNRGPILFSSRDVFPNLIEELMKSPKGLIFKVANYDMTDEFGRIFTFSNQIARDRTAGIIVDYGGETTKQHLIATALQPDVDGYGGSDLEADFPHVGGFNADGSAIGIPLDFALQDTLGLKKNATIEDGIVAGPNREAESIAQGDDVQVIPPQTTGVGVGSIVISAGQNGVLETSPLGDDQVDVTSGYETSLSCNSVSDNARAICLVDSDCTGIGSEDEPAACNGPEVLVRFDGYRNGDLNRAWVVMTNQNIPAGADFGKVILKPGADLYLAFVQDLDQDGLFAREEYMEGSTDSRADIYDNQLFGENFDEESVESQIPDGRPDSVDTDRDGMGDFSEVRVGWKVAADGGTVRQVYSSPRLRDSDGDQLLDPVERDLRAFCATDPNDDNFVDPRTDALCSFQSDETVIQEEAFAIIAGPNGIADSIANAGDEQLVAAGTANLSFATSVIGVGTDEGIQTELLGDDLYESLSNVPPATDPVSNDTDLDNISDFDELQGFEIGLSIRDGGDGIADTVANGDDIQKAFANNPVTPFGIVILPGPNGTIDTIADGDDINQDGRIVKTDPLRRDTDNDSVADGLEIQLGGDPTDASDSNDFRDSDQDGLTDSEESSLGWEVIINGVSIGIVNSNPSLPDSDFDGLPDLIERDIRSNPNNKDSDGDGLSDFDEFADFERFFGLSELYSGFSVNGSESEQYGTSLLLSDTDGDTLTDENELLVGYRVLLAGEDSFRQIYTNPLVRDTDFDGQDDNLEINRGGSLDPTDATDPDTDDDGRTDGQEFIAQTDPLVPDVGVKIRYSQLKFNGGPSPYNAQWNFNYSLSTGTFPGFILSQDEDKRNSTVFDYLDAPFNFLQVSNLSTLSLGREQSFSLRPGQGFTMNGFLQSMVIDVTPPITYNIAECQMTYLKDFSYEDVVDQGYQLITENLIGGDCRVDVIYEIFVN